MGKRGPKSGAEKELEKMKVIDGGFQTGAPGLPAPPGDLNEPQMAIWNAVVRSEPPGFFESDATQALLADYCRHRDSSEQVSKIINEFKPEWLKLDEGAKRYESLLRMRDRENRALLRCATKLRITNQARYTPQAAATAARNRPKAARPWESS